LQKKGGGYKSRFNFGRARCLKNRSGRAFRYNLLPTRTNLRKQKDFRCNPSRTKPPTKKLTIKLITKQWQ
jgi:hypothetical protein